MNKQGDSIQPWSTPFPIWNQSLVPCLFLPVASWPEYRFLRRQVIYSHLLKNFPQFVVIYTVKGFGVISKAEVDVFLEFNGCWQFNLCFLCLFWNQLEHLEVHSSCIAEAWLGEFEHRFASVWDECECAVVGAFCGIVLFSDWNENGPFPVLRPLLSFPNLFAYWVQHFYSIGVWKTAQFFRRDSLLFNFKSLWPWDSSTVAQPITQRIYSLWVEK